MDNWRVRLFEAIDRVFLEEVALRWRTVEGHGLDWRQWEDVGAIMAWSKYRT